MDAADAKELLDEILPTIEETFQEFLADPTNPFNEDNPIHRVAFYTTMLMTMRADPIEDDEEGMQEVLENKVTEMLEENQKLLFDML